MTAESRSRERSAWTGPLGVAFVLVVVYVLARLLGPILVPFVIAWILAYVANPPVRWLMRHGWARPWATILVSFVLIFCVAILAFIFLPLATQQALRLGEAALRAWPAARTHIAHFLAHWGLTIPSTAPAWRSLVTHALRHWSRIGVWASGVLGVLTRSGLVVVMTVFDIVLVPLLTFYFLRDWDRIARQLGRLVPRGYRRDLARLLGEANHVLGAFLRGQLLVMVALAVTYTVGLVVVGLKSAIFVGLFAGFMSFVPYLGFASGVLVGELAMLVSGGGVSGMLAVAIVFAVGEILESFVYVPLLVGGRARLHPLVVIFVLLAGGRLLGFLGVLAAVPVTAVVAVFGRELLRRYRRGSFYRSGRRGEDGSRP